MILCQNFIQPFTRQGKVFCSDRKAVYKNISNLRPGCIYHFKVQVRNSAAESDWGSVESFTTPQIDGPCVSAFGCRLDDRFDIFHCIEDMPGDIVLWADVAWNGSPGSVEFKVNGLWYPADRLERIEEGIVRATLNISYITDSISQCNEGMIKATNGEGSTTLVSTRLYFYPLPGAIEDWFLNQLEWRNDGGKFTYLDRQSWTLWDVENPFIRLSTKGSVSYGQKMAFDPRSGTFKGSLDGRGDFGLNLDVSNVELITASSLGLTGGLDVALAGCQQPIIEPFWELSTSGRAGVGAPAVVVVGVVFPPAKPPIDAALRVPILKNTLKSLKLRLFLTSAVTVRGEYAGSQTADCFLGATSIDLSGQFGIEGQAVLDARLGGVKIYAGGSGSPEFQICPDFQFCQVKLDEYAGVQAYVMVFGW